MKKSKTKQMFYRKWKTHALHLKSKCDDCNEALLYFCKYDADFCPQCDKWISENCNDPACSYCAGRPETPRDALAACKMLPDEERASRNKLKDRAMRHYIANEKYRNRKNRCN